MNPKGIGLGLVIAKSICSQFDGDIFLRNSITEPKRDHGSSFEFQFRLLDEKPVTDLTVKNDQAKIYKEEVKEDALKLNSSKLVFDQWNPEELDLIKKEEERKKEKVEKID
jgi:hypothetical protein